VKGADPAATKRESGGVHFDPLSEMTFTQFETGKVYRVW
jgi:hypothetical protein